MADDEPVLRPLRETDLDALFRFRARLWPEGDYHRSRDYWDWNVMRNPHALSGQGPPVGLALRGAEVLAECQGLPAALLQAGLPRAASWCVELYTEPSAQRRGLGSRLVAQWISSAGIPLVMGPSRASHPVFVSAGLRPLGVLSSYLAPTGLLGLLLASFRGRGASAGPLPESRSISRFEPDWDPVWRAARGNAAHIRRDHAWLNWRFVEQPEVSYERLGFFRGGSPCGYAVLRAGADARCRLADLAVLPEALGGALARCLEHARSLGAKALQFPCFAPSLEARLQALGFRNEGAWRPLLSEPGAGEWDWFVSSADSDQEHPEDAA